MFYRNILSQAWKITWQNKYLWFFGLFAALLGNGGEYEILVKGLSIDNQPIFPGLESLKGTGVFSRDALSNIIDLAKNDTLSLFMVLLLTLVVIILSAFLVWLSITSQAAIVSNTAGIIGNRKTDFKAGVAAGIKNFWPVFSLNLIIKILTYFVLFLIGFPLVYAAAKTGFILANLIYVIAFIIFMVFVLAVSFIIKYAIGFNVIKGMNLKDSLFEGWKLFKGNWLVSMEMAFILFFLSLLISFAYFLVVLVFAIPFMLLAFIFSKFSAIGFLLVMLLAIIFYIISLAFAGSTLATFQISSWTILFLQLLSKGGTSKIVRMVEEWGGK